MAARVKLLQRRLSTNTPSLMQAVSTKNTPPPAAPYSQAIKANGVIYLSGQVALTPENKMVEGTIQDRTQQCFDNLKAVLEAAGSSVDKIVKLGVYATDMENFSKINEVYVKFFNGHKPARTFVAVKSLPLGADVEIEAIALE